MARPAPGKSGEAGLDAAPALYFFRLIVKGGVAVFYFAQTRDNAGMQKQHFHKGGFAAAASADQGVSSLCLNGIGHRMLPK
jgi:hypothetical protein